MKEKQKPRRIAMKKSYCKTVRTAIAIFTAVVFNIINPWHIWADSIPVRLNINFIVDANGNRPATGRLNTDAEIIAEFDAGNNILKGVISEFQLQRLNLSDLAGVSQWYGSASNTANRNALRTAAMANPSMYNWRSDAINIYINGGTSSAIGSFPPNNDIILMNQGCTNNPSCMLHEIGHNLNLMHTHEGGGADGCADTISDNQSWTRDQLSQNNFGNTYANLTSSQRAQVDMVWQNVMSYHTSLPQNRLSPCQMNRISRQGYSDKNWLLTKIPIYVDFARGIPLFASGSFSFPYKNFQDALNAGGFSGKAFVLEQSGSYTMTQSSLNSNVEIITRSSTSTIRKGAQSYILPSVEFSNIPEVATAIKSVKAEDSASRQVMKSAEIKASSAPTAKEANKIRAAAKVKLIQHRDNALNFLKKAELSASGDEKLAVQLELAERYKEIGNCRNASRYYKMVADTTDQEHLRTFAQYQADNCGKR